jgi:hypothetical protein
VRIACRPADRHHARRLVSAAALLAVLAAPGTAPARAPHPAPWRSGFEGGSLSEWSFFGQGQEQLWGHVAVVDPVRYGVPRRQGARVVRFETTPGDVRRGSVHAKLYKFFKVRHRGHRRTNVSGTYSAWYYFPRGYHIRPRTADMVLEFKDEYTDGGGWHQDPTWWIEIDAASEWQFGGVRPDAPVAVLYHLDPRPPVTPVLVPRGRWFKIRIRLRQGRRIDVWLAGRHIATGYQREYPVGLRRGRHTLQWILGVGNYSQDADGPLYVDDVAYRP